MPQSWLRLSVRARAASLDAVSNFLIERGSPGVQVRRNRVDAYFARSPGNASLKRAVRRFLRDAARLEGRRFKICARWELVEQENWHDSWRRFIKARKVGGTFWVTPPWLAPPKSNRREVITIEPGMAFGTGTHATTRGCLESIEAAAACFHGKDFDVLDVGTGSGILAIASAKLGARSVWALDNDPVALQVARQNLRRNGVRQRVHVTSAAVTRLRRSFSLVVANLTAGTILGMLHPLSKRVKPRGFLVLSGILQSQAAAIRRGFGAGNLILVRRKRENEWVTLMFRRK